MEKGMDFKVRIMKRGGFMEKMEWMQQFFGERQKAELTAANEKTARYGLALSEAEMEVLLAQRKSVLRKEERVEFGEGILPKIIYAFCDSQYITQQDYAKTLGRLQEMFYVFKNEMEDAVTDQELLVFMREQFDGVCFGDLDYLEGTCLENFAGSIRAGSREFQKTGGRGVYGGLDEVKRWDPALYLEALRGKMS